MRFVHVRWLKAVADHAYRREAARKRYAEAPDARPPPAAPAVVRALRADSAHAVDEALARGDAEDVAAALRRAVSPPLHVTPATVARLLAGAKRRHALPPLDAPTLADAP